MSKGDSSGNGVGVDDADNSARNVSPGAQYVSQNVSVFEYVGKSTPGKMVFLFPRSDLKLYEMFVLNKRKKHSNRTY